VKESLKWNLLPNMVKDLVAYVVSRINYERPAAINENVAPKVLFTGIHLDYKKEFCLVFGDYCKVYGGTVNTSRARSIPCITLYPCNYTSGSWPFMNLKTRQRVRQSQWVKMVTTEEIVQKINSFDGIKEGQEGLPVEPVEEEVLRKMENKKGLSRHSWMNFVGSQ